MGTDTDFIRRATGASNLTDADKESIVKFLCEAYALYGVADPNKAIPFASFIELLTEGIHDAIKEYNRKKPRR